MLTKMTILRRETKDYTSEELEKAIENLLKIMEEKKEQEEALIEKLKEKEEVRLSAIAKLENSNIPVPKELKKPLELVDIMPKRRRRRRKNAEAEEISQ